MNLSTFVAYIFGISNLNCFCKTPTPLTLTGKKMFLINWMFAFSCILPNNMYLNREGVKGEEKVHLHFHL